MRPLFTTFAKDSQVRIPSYIVMALTLVVLCGCKENIDDITDAIQKIDHTLVRTKPVIISNKPMPIYSIGRLQSGRDIKLSFKIGGIISSLHAEEGDYVKKGTLLGTIRTNEIDAQVLKAQRAIEKSKRDLSRVNKMYHDGAATLEQVQDLTTLVAVNQADLDIAQFNQRYAKVVSPVSGRVLQKLAEANELIGPGQPVYIISSSSGSNYVMTASLSDRDVNRIKYKDRVEVQFDAFPDQIIDGFISQINESADPRTGTFNIEVSLEAHQYRLRNGIIGRISIWPDNGIELGRVPIEAIVETTGNNIVVFSPIEHDTIAKEWSVKPVKIVDEYVLINSDDVLFPNVITDGATYLIDGDKILISQ